MGAAITIRRRLDWADTDAAGFWHHSTFWKLAEAGEAELARRLGLSELLFGATPRRTVSAEFSEPVYFDDELDVTFSVESVGTTSATYLTDVDRGGVRVAEGRMVVVLIGDDGRPRTWPDEAARLLRGD